MAITAAEATTTTNLEIALSLCIGIFLKLNFEPRDFYADLIVWDFHQSNSGVKSDYAHFIYVEFDEKYSSIFFDIFLYNI